MKNIKSYVNILLLSLFLIVPLGAQGFFLIRKFKKTQTVKFKFSREVPLESKAKELNLVFVSDMNLYPIPVSQEEYPDPPKSKVGILYRESQVLFQEMIKTVLDLDKHKRVDLVLFGGSQVADNLHWDLFLDIAYDLTKSSIDYKYLIGDGELQGPKRLKDFAKRRYFYKEINGVHIVALNDVHKSEELDYILEQSHDLKPGEYQDQNLGPMLGFESVLPCKCITCFEELGCRQSNWLVELKDLLKKSVGQDEDVFVFSYKKLEPKLDTFLQDMPNLRLVAHSYDLKIDIKHTQGPIYMTNGALSVYPCVYTIIHRKANGDLIIENYLVPLKGVRRKGRDALQSLGFDYHQYDGSLINKSRKLP